MSRLAYFVRIHFPILAQSTTLPSYRPAAVQPPSSSSLQLSGRVAAVAVADCFDRSLRCSTRLYALPLAAAATYCCSCPVSGDMPASNLRVRLTLSLTIILVPNRSLYLCPGHVYDRYRTISYRTMRAQRYSSAALQQRYATPLM